MQFVSKSGEEGTDQGGPGIAPTSENHDCHPLHDAHPRTIFLQHSSYADPHRNFIHLALLLLLHDAQQMSASLLHHSGWPLADLDFQDLRCGHWYAHGSLLMLAGTLRVLWRIHYNSKNEGVFHECCTE